MNQSSKCKKFILRSQTGDGKFRAPLPGLRRYVPYSAPHPDAAGVLVHGRSVSECAEAQDGLGRAGAEFREKFSLGV